MLRLPKDWSTWGSYPSTGDKDLHTYNVIWRAFCPDHSLILEVVWKPEQDPKGSMAVRLITDENWLEPLYETKAATVKELTQVAEEIMGKLPDPSVVVMEPRRYSKASSDSSGGRTSSLKASSVTTRPKRKYTKKSARWKQKDLT